jgi:hypothetical protein
MLISLARSKELEEKPEVEIGEKEKEAAEEGGKKSASRSPSRENGVAAIKQEEEEKQKKEVESVQAKRNYRLTINVPVVYMVRYKVVLRVDYP